jgi:hypothetical protein
VQQQVRAAGAAAAAAGFRHGKHDCISKSSSGPPDDAESWSSLSLASRALRCVDKLLHGEHYGPVRFVL